MPPRIQAQRPWYPRVYQPYARGGGGGGGMGNIGQTLGKAIQGMMQTSRQNQIANQILNTQTPPRAALVAPGVNPRTNQPNVIAPGTATWGSAPQTGGLAELQMRQQANQAQLSDAIQRARLAMYIQKAQPDQTAAQIKQAQLDLLQARTKKLGEPTQAKPGKYEPGSSTPMDPGYYDFNHQRADFDAQHGKGSYDRLLAGSGYIKQDPNTGDWVANPDNPPPTDSKGNPLVSVDKKGNITLAPQGSYPGANIPRDSINSNMARYDATLNRQGQAPRFLGTGSYMQSQNPQSGITGGDQANPYMPKSTTDLQAIPDGQWFVSPKDGKTYQKAGSQPQQTSQVNTGDQGTQLAANQLAPDVTGSTVASQPAQNVTGPNVPNQPPQLAGLTPTSTPGSFNLGTLPLGGVGQDTSLADAIRQAQVGNQLQGVA